MIHRFLRNTLRVQWVIMEKKIGDKLLEIRNRRNLTQQQMADLTDISLRYYQALEYSENEPSATFVKKICLGLKIDPNELLFDKVPTPIPIQPTDALLKIWLTLDPEKRKMLLEAADSLSVYTRVKPKLKITFDESK